MMNWRKRSGRWKLYWEEEKEKVICDHGCVMFELRGWGLTAQRRVWAFVRVDVWLACLVVWCGSSVAG